MLCLSLLLTSFSEAPVTSSYGITATTDYTSSSILYNSLCLDEKGLSKKAFDLAYKGYQKLLKKKMITNPGYLTICDMSQSSRRKRLYLIDLTNTQVLMNTWVAHGRNSGYEFATKFSNKLSSRQTSLGFYVTKDTYRGKHGLSLKLAGLEDGFNDNAESRAIVVHGADYVNARRARSAYMGRSQGCPALPQAQAARVINLIKGGSTLFVYHPSDQYLHESRILNS